MKSISETRNQIRALRRETDLQTRAANSSKICDRFWNLEMFQTAEHVAAYLAFDGEADPMELMTLAAERGKQIYLPVIVGKTKPLSFASWTPSTIMIKNRFGILEPHVELSKRVDADQLDFVVNPLVGFDEQCNRIGVGGGFYDRTFGFLNEPGKRKSVMLVGFAFEHQKLDSIEPQPWDVRLDAVVTESKVYL